MRAPPINVSMFTLRNDSLLQFTHALHKMLGMRVHRYKYVRVRLPFQCCLWLRRAGIWEQRPHAIAHAISQKSPIYVCTRAHTRTYIYLLIVLNCWNVETTICARNLTNFTSIHALPQACVCALNACQLTAPPPADYSREFIYAYACVCV